MGFGRFFYSGPIDDVILDCYRLAKHYGQDPDIFLKKSLSAIKRHMKWTSKLIEIQNPQDDE